MRKFFRLLKTTYTKYSNDKIPRTGAALAYYTVFSLAPLLIIVIAVAGLFFGREAVTGQLMAQISGLVGEEGSKAVSTMVASASKSGDGFIATLIGFATLLFGATGLFIQLQEALDEIWEVKSNRSEGVIGFIRSRWMSLTMVLGIGFLLLVSLIISAGITFLSSNTVLPLSGVALQVINLSVSTTLIAMLFALIFKYLPNVQIAWQDVIPGALMTAVLFAVGKQLIGIYLGRAAVSNSFGAAGSLVIILLWSYYSSQILLFGAAFTNVYARQRGQAQVPKAGFIGKDETRRQISPPRRC